MEPFLADRDAFAAFYRAHARAVLVFFTRRTFDPEAALDLTAETFAVAFTSRRRFRGSSSGEAGAWLMAIAKAQLAGYFREGTVSAQLRRRLAIVTPAASDAELERIEEIAALGALRGSLREQLAALDQGQREALWLRVVDEQPYAAVAARLGISEQAARARVSRALRTIGDALAGPPAMIEEHSP